MPDAIKSLDPMARAYLDCALWTATDEEGGRLDRAHSLYDFAPQAIAHARETCEDFRTTAGDLLNGLDSTQAGHDLWLTRNRHGAGFWDRGLGDVGRKLTALAHPYGDSYVYVGNDGQLHLTD